MYCISQPVRELHIEMNSDNILQIFKARPEIAYRN